MLYHRDSKDASDLEASRFLRYPMAVMTGAVMGVILDLPGDVFKYMIYSAHDDSITNMLRFLGKDFDWIPFAATVTFEVKYSEKCVKEGSTDPGNCFGVSILSNGVPLRFDECSGDVFTLNGCKYEEFYAMIQKKWYSGPGAPDINQACFTKVEQPPKK